MKQKVYISGAIAHLNPDERRAAFERAEAELTDRGYDVFNPFKNGLPYEADWHEHMRVDIRALMDCDIILMLDGWEHSKGCKLELDVASSCGIKVCFDEHCGID